MHNFYWDHSLLDGGVTLEPSLPRLQLYSQVVKNFKQIDVYAVSKRRKRKYPINLRHRLYYRIIPID